MLYNTLHCGQAGREVFVIALHQQHCSHECCASCPPSSPVFGKIPNAPVPTQRSKSACTAVGTSPSARVGPGSEPGPSGNVTILLLLLVGLSSMDSERGFASAFSGTVLRLMLLLLIVMSVWPHDQYEVEKKSRFRLPVSWSERLCLRLGIAVVAASGVGGGALLRAVFRDFSFGGEIGVLALRLLLILLLPVWSSTVRLGCALAGSSGSTFSLAARLRRALLGRLVVSLLVLSASSRLAGAESLPYRALFLPKFP